MTSGRNGQLPIPGLTVPLVTHPEAARARARGDLAERMLPLAAELACMVRDEDRETIGQFLDGHGLAPDLETRGLVVVLAAMVADSAPLGDLLAWVTWDEHGCALDPDDPRMWEDCGTLTAYWRHRYHRHRAGDIEACGCAQAGRGYWNARDAAKRAAAAGEADAA